jgi:hypothetical protein
MGNSTTKGHSERQVARGSRHWRCEDAKGVGLSGRTDERQRAKLEDLLAGFGGQQGGVRSLQMPFQTLNRGVLIKSPPAQPSAWGLTNHHLPNHMWFCARQALPISTDSWWLTDDGLDVPEGTSHPLVAPAHPLAGGCGEECRCHAAGKGVKSGR